MKKYTLNRIIVWAAASLLLLVMLITSVKAYNGYSIDNVYEEPEEIFDDDELGSFCYDNSATYDVDELTSLSIFWASGEVIIEESDNDLLEIRQYADTTTDEFSPMLYKLDGDLDLFIYSSEADIDLSNLLKDGIQALSGYNITAKPKTLVVSVPKDTAVDELIIATASADINITDKANYLANTEISSFSGAVTAKGIECPTIYVNTASGKSQLDNIICGDISVNTVSGDVSISGKIDYFDANTVSADVSFNSENGYTVQQIDVNTVSGSANLTFPKDCNGFTIDTKSLSGSFSSKFGGKQEEDEYVYGDGYTAISFNSMSGNLTISPAESSTEETKQPETTKPETTKPETTKPETTKPETTQPETTQPETTQPETTKPDATKAQTATNPPTTKKAD